MPVPSTASFVLLVIQAYDCLHECLDNHGLDRHRFALQLGVQMRPFEHAGRLMDRIVTRVDELQVLVVVKAGGQQIFGRVLVVLEFIQKAEEQMQLAFVRGRKH